MQQYSKPPHNVPELLDWASHYLCNFNIEEPRLESEIILSHVLRTEIIELYINPDRFLSNIELYRYIELLKRRSNHEPIAYIIKNKEFWSLEFEVNQNVLIPRPETEFLVNSVLPFLKYTSNTPMKVLDIGTGSGAIITALAKEVPLHEFYALDISYEAICVAEKNAIKHGVIDRISFFISCWTSALDPDSSCFDLIVSNPPYIESNELKYLQPEIVNYEPTIALDGGYNGIECIKSVIENSKIHLNKGGILAIEIGYDQGNIVRQIINHCCGYSNMKIIKDYSGLDRIIHMVKN